MSYEAYLVADARLVILRALNERLDGRSNETVLTVVLDGFGHRRSREWVRTQLRALADVGAVTVTEAGSVLIAEITRAGVDHVERRGVIEGVAKPSPEA